MARNGKISIVLTDDHKVVSHALRSFFESFPDIRVAGIAAIGEELLSRLAEWLPDVAVVDLLMPGGIDGVESDTPRCAVLSRCAGDCAHRLHR